jgi:hypothetical protein
MHDYVAARLINAREADLSRGRPPRPRVRQRPAPNEC